MLDVDLNQDVEVHVDYHLNNGLLGLLLKFLNGLLNHVRNLWYNVILMSIMNQMQHINSVVMSFLMFLIKKYKNINNNN
jgi:hypothetical protein